MYFSSVFFWLIDGFGSLDFELYQLEDFLFENTELLISKVLFWSIIFLFFDSDFNFEIDGIFLTTQAEDSVIKLSLLCLEKGFVDFEKTRDLSFLTFLWFFFNKEELLHFNNLHKFLGSVSLYTPSSSLNENSYSHLLPEIYNSYQYSSCH